MISISFLAAYFGGLLSFLAPCGAILLPGFLAYSFKTPGKLLMATFFFWLGFAAIFIPFGMSVAWFVKTLLFHRVFFSWIAGVTLFAFGIASFLGKGITARPAGVVSARGGYHSAFVFGIAFGTAFGGCIAPILGGITTIATSSSAWSGFWLLLTYTFGMVTPLLIFSFVADKKNFTQSKWMRGKVFEYALFGKKFFVHSTNIIAGVFLIALGLLFIVSRGTFYLLPTLEKIGVTDWYLRYNNAIINIFTSGTNSILLGFFAVAFAFAGWRALFRRKKDRISDEAP